MHLKRWFQWAYSVWCECSWKDDIGQEANITWKGAFIWYIEWEVNELRKIISVGLLGENWKHMESDFTGFIGWHVNAFGWDEW